MMTTESLRPCLFNPAMIHRWMWTTTRNCRMNRYEIIILKLQHAATKGHHRIVSHVPPELFSGNGACRAWHALVREKRSWPWHLSQFCQGESWCDGDCKNSNWIVWIIMLEYFIQITFCHILSSKSRSTLPDPSVSNSLPQCKVRISIARDMGSLPSISLRIRQRVLKSSTCPADRHPQLAHNDAERLYKLTRFDKHEIASFWQFRLRSNWKNPSLRSVSVSWSEHAKNHKKSLKTEQPASRVSSVPPKSVHLLSTQKSRPPLLIVKPVASFLAQICHRWIQFDRFLQ